MSDDLPVTRFKIHLRCLNCRKDTARVLVVPCGNDEPETVDELVESAILQRQRFSCSQCDSSIGTITAVTIARQAERAA